jgi:hypothetical protein
MADYRPTRRQREQKAFNYLVVSGTTGLATVVTAILALVSSFSWGIVFLLALICAGAGFMFKRATGT